MAILLARRPLLRPASLSGNNVVPGTRFHRPSAAVVEWQQKMGKGEVEKVA